MPVTTAYLEDLNLEQRRAVEHGVTELDCTAGPLLVIAGAGSGKTNTLAHRVAHLIVNGADPRRILLMTFSRRAAAEMTKRVERISRKAIGDKAGVMTGLLLDLMGHLDDDEADAIYTVKSKHPERVIRQHVRQVYFKFCNRSRYLN
jgi:superfamily I DNA/RNA helicase